MKIDRDTRPSMEMARMSLWVMKLAADRVGGVPIRVPFEQFHEQVLDIAWEELCINPGDE